MARNSTPQMAKILEHLELERPELVTIDDLNRIAKDENIATPAAILASRLREKGWLLPTGQRGVWEFIPAEVAGSYSSMDPLIPIKAFSATRPKLKLALATQAAAWALGLADRAPTKLDVVSSKAIPSTSIPSSIRLHTFIPTLPTRESRGVQVLAPESLIVDMATAPTKVSSWQSAVEWLPDVAYEMDVDNTLTELADRKASVCARTGYLLQGMRPDISEAIMKSNVPHAKVRFGLRAKSLRNDEKWMISDTLLPFDPKTMEAVK